MISSRKKKKKKRVWKKKIFLTLCALSNFGMCGGNVGLTTIWPWRPSIKGSRALSTLAARPVNSVWTLARSSVLGGGTYVCVCLYAAVSGCVHALLKLLQYVALVCVCATPKPHESRYNSNTIVGFQRLTRGVPFSLRLPRFLSTS